jgi:methylthioribose-1-phosphate isomerase
MARPETPTDLLDDLDRSGDGLVASRPTAVNLSWAAERVSGAARAAAERTLRDAPLAGVRAIRTAVVEEALRIAADNERSCAAIGAFGQALVPPSANVLTHCNTGVLATGADGTAQSVIAAAHARGTGVHVWVDETRPMLQGARLTAWELAALRIPMTLVADTAAGSLMERGLVDLVVVGADRIAANGDVANKVGTYQLAVLAKAHRIPFYVAAPVSTVDPETRTGAGIVIEEREPDEVTHPRGIAFAPPGVTAANPSFDVTPARLVSAIVTERGIARRPFSVSLRRLLAAPSDSADVGARPAVSGS